jgi:hypothetical protein
LFWLTVLEVPDQDQVAPLLWASGEVKNDNGTEHMVEQTAHLVAVKEKKQCGVRVSFMGIQ